MSATTWDASAFVRLAEQCRRAAPVVAREVQAAMDDSLTMLQHSARGNLERAGAVDTKALIDSLEPRIVSTGVGYLGTPLAYAATVERGRRAGAALPPRTLQWLEWLARHDIPLSADFVIRRAIARRGIRPRPYLGPALTSNQRAIDRRFGQANVRVLGFVLTSRRGVQ